MLATSGRPSGPLTSWSAEFKADGYRCQLSVVDGRLVARTRGGHDIADQVPELSCLAALGVDVVLDGELIVGAGRPADFYAVAGAVSSRRRDRATVSFIGFDILWLGGVSLLQRPHVDRRHLLNHLSALSDGALPVVASFPGSDLDELLVACDELDLEGVVLKRRNSSYRPGRSKHWRKVKTDAWRTVHLPARQRSYEPG
jgi:bifunctional non-homologous end joining protein LigD